MYSDWVWQITKFFMEFFMEKNLFEGYIIQRCGAISGENESLWKDKVKRDYKHADSRKVTKIKRSEILGEVPLILLKSVRYCSSTAGEFCQRSIFSGIHAIEELHLFGWITKQNKILLRRNAKVVQIFSSWEDFSYYHISWTVWYISTWVYFYI